MFGRTISTFPLLSLLDDLLDYVVANNLLDVRLIVSTLEHSARVGVLKLEVV